MICQDFRAQIVHFQADELAPPLREALQNHLNECERCAARLEVENSFLRGLRARVVSVPAPPGLETRIRASLASESLRAGLGPWFSRPWFAALSAAVILAVLILPSLSSGTHRMDPGEVVEIAGQEVLVVDRNCDVAGRTLLQQRNCQSPRHFNALKLSNGTYWNVSLDQVRGESVLVDRELRGKRLVVQGQLFTKIHTLLLNHFDVLEDTVTQLHPDHVPVSMVLQ